VLTTSRKVFLAFLGLALVALAVDRLVLSSGTLSPKSAAAAPSLAPDVSRGSVVATASKPHPRLTAGASDTAPPTRPALTERLEAVAKAYGCEPECTREAFLPPDAWRVQPQEPPPPPEPVPIDLAAEFVKKHRLTSILVGGSTSRAIIDGRVMAVGTEIDGFRLTRLVPQGAIFQSTQDPKQEARLRMTEERK
jgi:hypothetical protein